MPSTSQHQRPRRRRQAALAAAAFIILSACGGGDDTAPPSASFQVSDASPGAHDGALAAPAPAGVTTELRAPDGISDVPYCLVRYPALQHANGRSYLMGVAFASGDARVLVVTLAQRDSGWWVAAFNPPATQAGVDLRARRLSLRQLRSTQGLEVGWQATISGDSGFPSAADTAACG